MMMIKRIPISLLYGVTGSADGTVFSVVAAPRVNPSTKYRGTPGKPEHEVSGPGAGGCIEKPRARAHDIIAYILFIINIIIAIL